MDTSRAIPFGDLLRRYRVAAGMTQETLAERAGLSVRGIADLERGVRRAPYRDTIQRLSTALALDAACQQALAAAARPPRMTPAVRTALDDTGDVSAPTPLALVIPMPPTPLIGRAANVAELRARLLHGAVRLLTLTGTGGVGKTRLAIELAAGTRPDFVDGVYFVALDAIRDPSLVAAAVAQALGVRQTGTGSFVDALTVFLAERHVLLVLDNFEQVLPAAVVVSDLLTACPRLTVMATSRAPLRLRAEHVVAVSPLDLPDPAHVDDPARLAHAPAVALFVARAHAAADAFTLTVTNAGAVAELCRRLDGLPLAIELAAAGVRVTSPQIILDRLQDHTAVLGDGFQDLPVRQQALRATLDWSYDLLQEPEQALFRRLSVFAGGFDLPAAESVCTSQDDGVSGNDPAAGRIAPAVAVVLGRLGTLVDQSLVQVETREDEVRYRLLETVREYGLERLRQAGEESEVRRCHAAHYLALARAADQQVLGAEAPAWLTRLEREHDNLRTALAAAELSPPGDALLLAVAMWHFWQAHGHLSEGRAWLDRLMVLAGAAPGSVRAAALLGAASIALDQGDYAGAALYVEQSLALAGETDGPGAAEALLMLGTLAYRRSDYAAAATHGEESLLLARTLGDQRLAGRCLHLRGLIALDEGRYQIATERFRDALASIRAVGDVRLSARILNNLGLAAQRMEDFAGARAYLEESLALNRWLGNSVELARNLITLALVSRASDDSGAAERLAAEALTLSRDMGNRNGITEALSQLSGIARQRGDLDAARSYSALHLREAQAMDYPMQMLAAVTEAAANARAAGQMRRATRLLAASEAGREAMGLAQHPRMRRSLEEHLRVLHDQLDEPSFAAAWAAGTAMSLNDAITHALTDADAEPDIAAAPNDSAPSMPDRPATPRRPRAGRLLSGTRRPHLRRPGA